MTSELSRLGRSLGQVVAVLDALAKADSRAAPCGTSAGDSGGGLVRARTGSVIVGTNVAVGDSSITR